MIDNKLKITAMNTDFINKLEVGLETAKNRLYNVKKYENKNGFILINREYNFIIAKENDLAVVRDYGHDNPYIAILKSEAESTSMKLNVKNDKGYIFFEAISLKEFVIIASQYIQEQIDVVVMTLESLKK